MATYIPNATQTTEPVESRTVESAALEFRTLKGSINSRIDTVQANLDAEEAARIAADSAEIANRIAGDANLQAQNNAQDVRLTAIENALPFIGEGGLPGTVYVQRLSGTGAQTVFTLNAAPQSNNVVDIYINGLYQNKDTFTVSGADVIFSKAPPAGTNNIEVQVTVTIALGETDASLVGFQQAGTGAVLRTVQDKLREAVTPEDFGAIGDGASHPLSQRYATIEAAQVAYPFATALTQEIDYCAIVAAINSKTYGTGWYVSGPEILLRNGAVYYLGSNTLQLKKSVRIRGANSGLPWTSMAAMKWSAGVTGIIVHRYNTLGAGVEATPTSAADGSVLEGFQLLGAASADADGFGGHGIWLRSRAICRDLYISGFRGNGYHIVAGAGAGGASEGNANNWQVSGGRVSNCENGIYTQGPDVNAGSADNVDVSDNRIWGVADRAFLGNTYISIHAASNGRDFTASQSAYATYDGNTYHAVPGNSSETLLATQPGTDVNVWRPCNPTSYAIAWTGANPAGTFREGGGLMSSDLNARTSFIGCYSEGGQGLTWLSQHSIAMGGFLLECPVASGAAFEGRFDSIWSRSGFVSERTRRSDNRKIMASVGGDANSLSAFEWSDSINGSVYRWQALPLGGFYMTRSGVNTGIMVRGPEEAQLPNYFSLSGLALGEGQTLRLFGRAIWSTAGGVLIPTSGTYYKGDIILAPNPNAGDFIGCICTTSGTAGSTAVFKSFGAIAA